jgi:outer membrane receptor protein involved in Fe transport
LIEQNDWLPSLSFKFQVRTNIDLQASWSRTVVRPTYREIAEVPLYDVTQNRTFRGNAALQMSASENLDLRASWYPRPGELVSAAVFKKKIDRPIELSAIRNDNSIITYQNFDQAEVEGIEGEIRFRLDRAWDPLESFTLGFNGAYITSKVPLTKDQMNNRAQTYRGTETERPLYDQPEYILNGSLTWDYQPWGTTITLSGGVVGQSLILVGLAKPDEFVQPAPDLNLFLRQKIGKNWDVRFTAKNLLDPEFQVAQSWPDVGETVLQSYTKGVTLGLSVGCEF